MAAMVCALSQGNREQFHTFPQQKTCLIYSQCFPTFSAEIVSEPPNNRLMKFEGKMMWNGKTYSLDNEKILLRGCILRNTQWCYGIVVFAGRDTKLMMNSGKAIFKRTNIDRLMNLLIIGVRILVDI